MRRTVFLMPLMVALAILWMDGAEVNAAAVCPSPAPTCTTSGNLTFVSGTYGCTLVSTASNGSVTVVVSQLVFDGFGNMNNQIQATNNNGAGTTFSPWIDLGAGTYCINTNKTGYIFPATPGCPIAFIVDAINLDGTSYDEVRTLDSTENLAAVAVCENVLQ